MSSPVRRTSSILSTPSVIALMGATLILLSLPLFAEVYRVVGPDGKITYTDQPSTTNEATTIEALPENDPSQNVVLSPKTVLESNPDWIKDAKEERTKKADAQQAKNKDQYNSWKDKIKAAKNAINQAANELEKGKEIVDGDFVGMTKGGARPSAEYLSRVRQLQKALTKAELNLKHVKKSKPR